MPGLEAPCLELGSVPGTSSMPASPSPSELSSASSPEPSNNERATMRPTPLFRALAMPPPDPDQPPGQDELERRLPGYRRIVIPRESTLIELLKQSSGVATDDEVLHIREAKLRVVAERVGLRRLDVLVPTLRKLTLDGSALTSLRDLGIGLLHLRVLSINKCNITSLDGVWGLGALRELFAAGNRLQDLQPLAALQKLHTLDLAKKKKACLTARLHTPRSRRSLRHMFRVGTEHPQESGIVRSRLIVGLRLERGVCSRAVKHAFFFLSNPISETSRVWTLGVCGALRRLTLDGTPASDMPDYRSSVAAALPMLVYLDGRPLHADFEYDSDEIFGAASSSESEVENETNVLLEGTKQQSAPDAEPGPLTSELENTSNVVLKGDGELQNPGTIRKKNLLRRPATTENAGVRPTRPNLPARPRTAVDRPLIDEPTRLQILHSLMDEEWLCSGSKLTSLDAVCGNLARALRRTTSAYHRHYKETDKAAEEDTMPDSSRSAASEIPRVPKLEDWIKFKEETGIDINIDLNERPLSADPSKILDRLEQIEKETQERFKDERLGGASSFGAANTSNLPNLASIRTDFEFCSQTNLLNTQSLSPNSNTDMYRTFFDDVGETHYIGRESFRFPDNYDS